MRDFYQVALPDFALVVPQTADGHIVTLLQYKHGVKRVSTMLPAGILQDGEEPLACAKRELVEETGFTSSQWHPLGRFVVDGNRGCGHAHFFAAMRARRTSEPRLDELEPFEVRLASPAAVLQAIDGGEMVALAHSAAFVLSVVKGLIRP